VAFTVVAVLSGCAAPFLGAALAAQGTSAAVALSLGPLDALRDSTASDPCRVLADKGISVSETLEIGVPANEGQAVVFETAWWRPEFVRDGYPQVERSRASREGVLTIGARSMTFVPPAGAVSVRIPYDLVRSVEVRGDASGTPVSLVVGSCEGRFDIVTFQRGARPDPTMTTDAAAALRARIATLRASAAN